MERVERGDNSQPDKRSPWSRGVFLISLGGFFLIPWFNPFFASPLPITVNLVDNGFSYPLSTRAQKAGELVRQLGKEQALVFPSAEAPLMPQSIIILSDQPVPAKFQIQKTTLQVARTEPQKTPIFTGLATWYPIDTGLTAASREFKRGTKLLVENPKNGRSVVVRINDYGPKAYTGAVLDLSHRAFARIAPLTQGKVRIRYRVVQ